MMGQRSHRSSLRLRGSRILSYISSMQHESTARATTPEPAELRISTEESSSSTNAPRSRRRSSHIEATLIAMGVSSSRLQSSQPSKDEEEQRRHERSTHSDAQEARFFRVVRKCKVDSRMLDREFARSAVTSWNGLAWRSIEGTGRCRMPIAAVTDGTYDGTFVDPDVRLFFCHLQLVAAEPAYLSTLSVEEQNRLERYWNLYGGGPSRQPVLVSESRSPYL